MTSGWRGRGARLHRWDRIRPSPDISRPLCDTGHDPVEIFWEGSPSRLREAVSRRLTF
jgi:hypothetical protein